MILNKYNEIMNNVSVDPEMKSRVMSAVSAAIREQSDGASVTKIPVHVNGNSDDKTPARKADVKSSETRKKAKKTPIALISSIAAAVIVIAGAIFVVNYMRSATKNTADIAMHNQEVDAVSAEMEIALETTASVEDGVKHYADNSFDSSTTAGTGYLSITNTDDSEKGATYTVDIGHDKDNRSEEADESEVMGDARLDGIARTLPFDIKGSGTGKFSDTITEEVIFGVNGEKVLIYTAPEGTEIINTVFHTTTGAGIESTTPAGVPAKLYRIPFGNVPEVEGLSASTDINAAVFTKEGKTYMVVFSDAQPQDVILKVADAV